MGKALQDESEELRAIYREADAQTHRDILVSVVQELIDKCDLRIHLDGTIYHLETKTK